MKTNLPMDVTVALAGLVLGFSAAAWTFASRDGGASARPEKPILIEYEAGREGRNRGVGKGEEAHSLAAFEKRLRKHAPGPDYTSQMERLGTAELKDLSGTLFKMMWQPPPEVQGPALRAIRDATRELYRREGTAALDWANALPLQEGKLCILQQMLFAAVEDSPVAAKPWVDLYQKEHGAGRSNPFLEVAIESASKQGVDAVLEVGKVFGEEMGNAPVASGPLPEGFDFKRLLGEFGGKFGMYQPIHLWAANDPDAAWQALKEAKGGTGELAGFHANCIFSGISQTQGEVAATKWLVPRLDELPAETREKAVYSMLGYHENRYQVVDEVMAALPKQSDRVTLASSLLSPFAGQAPLKILRDLGTASAQAEALVNSAKRFSRDANDPANPLSKQVNEFFTGIVQELDLPPADRERVLETLRTPQDLFPK